MTGRSMPKQTLSGLLLLCALSLNAQTTYVAPGGADTNPGTLDLPFRTISHAVGVSATGDTIAVRGGTYVITAAITLSRSATPSSRINLLA
jgi:hypothetical protein